MAVYRSNQMTKIMMESGLAVVVLGEEAHGPMLWLRDFFRTIEVEAILSIMVGHGIVSGREELDKLLEGSEKVTNKLLGI